jgi:hypothetical protein
MASIRAQRSATVLLRPVIVLPARRPGARIDMLDEFANRHSQNQGQSRRESYSCCDRHLVAPPTRTIRPRGFERSRRASPAGVVLAVRTSLIGTNTNISRPAGGPRSSCVFASVELMFEPRNVLLGAFNCDVEFAESPEVAFAFLGRTCGEVDDLARRIISANPSSD